MSCCDEKKREDTQGTLYVLAPGTNVVVGGDVPAIVCAVNIKDTRVQYQVSWWCGREYKIAWVEPFELRVDGCYSERRIGFMGE